MPIIFNGATLPALGDFPITDVDELELKLNYSRSQLTIVNRGDGDIIIKVWTVGDSNCATFILGRNKMYEPQEMYANRITITTLTAATVAIGEG